MNNWIYKSNNDNDIVFSSKIKLFRNFKDLFFFNKLNYIKGRENGKNIYNVFINELNDEKIILYEMWNSNENINKEYEEKNLISKELFKNADKAFFVVNEDEMLSIMINEEDYIKL